MGRPWRISRLPPRDRCPLVEWVRWYPRCRSLDEDLGMDLHSQAAARLGRWWALHLTSLSPGKCGLIARVDLEHQQRKHQEHLGERAGWEAKSSIWDSTSSLPPEGQRVYVWRAKRRNTQSSAELTQSLGVSSVNPVHQGAKVVFVAPVLQA